MIYIQTDLPPKVPLKSKRDYDRERAAREKFTDGELLAMAASALSRMQLVMKKAQLSAEFYKATLQTYIIRQERARRKALKRRLLILIASGLSVFVIVSILLLVTKVHL